MLGAGGQTNLSLEAKAFSAGNEHIENMHSLYLASNTQ